MPLRNLKLSHKLTLNLVLPLLGLIMLAGFIVSQQMHAWQTASSLARLSELSHTSSDVWLAIARAHISRGTLNLNSQTSFGPIVVVVVVVVVVGVVVVVVVVGVVVVVVVVGGVHFGHRSGGGDAGDTADVSFAGFLPGKCPA